MFKTPVEAQKLWCPHAIATDDDNKITSVNRDQMSGKGLPECRCVGPECALWIDGKELGSVPGRGLLGCNPAAAALAARMAGAKTGA